MKDLVANKQLTEEDDEVRMNPRCSALLQNHLPPKENDPGSFILSCSIRQLDFNNALADLGASISIMPFSMFKCLGRGKLKPIDMVLEMADDTICIPKGIVKNLLIKIDKFFLPVYFVIFDMIEDFRMPVILERPLLATAYAKVDIFQKTISLEVGNEKLSDEGSQVWERRIGGQSLCSFFVSNDNIEFLEKKDPPHESWLSILFSEEILYSRMCVWLELLSLFCA
ncbi:hypothetical protein Tco_1456251 [Tanacetum coccineum]